MYNTNFGITKKKDRDWSPKFETGPSIIIVIVQKVWVINLSFCQNDVHTSRGIILAKGQIGYSYTFWTTLSIMIFSPVSNFGDQSLGIYIVNHLRFQEIWVGLFAKPLSFPHHKLFSLLDSDDQGFPVPQEEVHPHVQDVRVKVAHLKKEM